MGETFFHFDNWDLHPDQKATHRDNEDREIGAGMAHYVGFGSWMMRGVFCEMFPKCNSEDFRQFYLEVRVKVKILD